MTRYLSSLRFRLVMLVLLSTLPALALTLYTGLEKRRYAAQNAQVDALRLTRLALSNFSTFGDGTDQLLTAISILPDIRQGEGEDRIRLLPDFHSNALKFHIPGQPPHLRISSQLETTTIRSISLLKIRGWV